MFWKSKDLYGNKVGDSKFYKDIIKSNSYVDELKVKRKECIKYVQKRMHARLYNCKKSKRPGRKGKLTGKLIDDLCMCHSFAIHGNPNTDENPQHHFHLSGRIRGAHGRNLSPQNYAVGYSP
ncbi:hypothetical protein J437_LFUL003774 [Ladona fulva]|uniref:Mutator-like transposase domain-containing protein n=1 Tax=Ladona fulva TaxID=123851 RepID=A0A8K0NUZ6_LADFU|nr:hypothetical protein J437_LFUL003774 [Ladona fulva]